jgi:hypothetical protein
MTKISTKTLVEYVINEKYGNISSEKYIAYDMRRINGC